MWLTGQNPEFWNHAPFRLNGKLRIFILAAFQSSILGTRRDRTQHYLDRKIPNVAGIMKKLAF